MKILVSVSTAFVLLSSGTAFGASITLSDVSSDLTPASQLDAIINFQVGEFDAGNAGDELQITLTNPSAPAGDALFNLSELYWNVDDSLEAGLTAAVLLSATHSVNGDVTGLWDPVQTDQTADGFGLFDFALTDGVGELSPGLPMPGQSIVFVIAIEHSVVPLDASDFLSLNANGYVAAAKFVNGPDDPEAPGSEDSAFGAAVPEPGTFALVSLGVVALAAGRRRR